MTEVLKAEKLLKEADLIWSNNEIGVDKIAAAYDKAAKAAPKGDSLIARAQAVKATMYFLDANRAEPKLQKKLLAKALKASAEAAKDSTCLLGTYANAKIRLKLGQTTKDEIEPIVRKVREAEAITWEDHFAKVKNIGFEEGQDAAIEMLKSIVKINGFEGDFRAHNMLGIYAYKEGQYELAAKHYEIAVALDPRLINAFYELSKSYGILANVDDQQVRNEYLQKEREALYGYRKARSLTNHKEDKVALSGLLGILPELGEHEEAFELSTQAVKLFGKKDDWPHLSLGVAYSYKAYSSDAERAKFEKLARAEFAKSHKLKPGSPHTTVSEAVMLANFGKIEEAVAKLNEAQLLMHRPEARAEAEAFPEVQEFVRTMLDEGRQNLIAKVKALGEQKDADTISLGEEAEPLYAELRGDYNESVQKSNAKAHELVRAGINAVRDGAQIESIISKAEVQYSYRTQLAQGKEAVFDLEKGIAALRADSNETAYGYFLGFFQTLRAAYTSATLAADNKFSLDVSNPVSKAASLLKLLPFGGEVASYVVKGGVDMIVKAKVEGPLKNLFGVCSDFEFGPMMGRVALKVTYAKKAYLESQKPTVTTRFEKFKSALKKLITDDAQDKFYSSPEEFEGHKDAVAVLKELYQGDKGEIAASPRASFESRLEKYSLEHALGDHADQTGIDFIAAIETALAGCASTLGEMAS